MGKIIVKHVSAVDPTIFKCRESRRVITPEAENSLRMSLHLINRYQRGVSYLVKYPENDLFWS